MSVFLPEYTSPLISLHSFDLSTSIFFKILEIDEPIIVVKYCGFLTVGPTTATVRLEQNSPFLNKDPIFETSSGLTVQTFSPGEIGL